MLKLHCLLFCLLRPSVWWWWLVKTSPKVVTTYLLTDWTGWRGLVTVECLTVSVRKSVTISQRERVKHGHHCSCSTEFYNFTNTTVITSSVILLTKKQPQYLLSFRYSEVKLWPISPSREYRESFVKL